MKTKFNYRILWIILLIAVLSFLTIYQSNAQERVSFGIYQDTKLALLGDEHGNDAFTTNILINLKMQGHQKQRGKYYGGYMVIYPEFEFADLHGGEYKRYSANIGYTFNQLFKNFEYTACVSFGLIDRWKASYHSWGLNGEIAYLITDNLKINALAQFVKRRDLGHRYGGEHLRFSGFIGINYNIL